MMSSKAKLVKMRRFIVLSAMLVFCRSPNTPVNTIKRMKCLFKWAKRLPTVILFARLFFRVKKSYAKLVIKRVNFHVLNIREEWIW